VLANRRGGERRDRLNDMTVQHVFILVEGEGDIHFTGEPWVDAKAKTAPDKMRAAGAPSKAG